MIPYMYLRNYPDSVLDINENRSLIIENDIHWVKNEPFFAEFKLRSGFNSLEKLDDKRIYYLSQSQFKRLVNSAVIDKGVVKGYWGFTKHGERFTVKYLGESI